MPVGDPGGNYASGGAVNQGGPSGPNSPGNMGNMGGGGGGSNFSSAFAGSKPKGQSYTIPFGWQPERPTQWSPDVYAAFNPANINYTDMPQHPAPHGTVAGGGYARWGGGRPNPGGAGGYNSGQGGMGAGRRAALIRALGGGGISGMNTGRGVRMG